MLLRVGRTATSLPGLLALWIDPSFLLHARMHFQGSLLIVTGTNGKSTTTSLATRLLHAAHRTVITNRGGANMVQGLVTALSSAGVRHLFDPNTIWLFELDEGTALEQLPLLHPQIVVLTNLFRDQLDRYADIDTLQSNLIIALRRCSESGYPCTIVVNADDPLSCAIADTVQLPSYYYGIDGFDTGQTSTLDSSNRILAGELAVCPVCGEPLVYSIHSFAQFGHWSCPQKHIHRPQPDISADVHVDQAGRMALQIQTRSMDHRINTSLPLFGLYNAYNALAAIAALVHLEPSAIEQANAAWADVLPVFGRFERLQGRQVYLVLTKNPIGMDLALEEALHFHGPKRFLFAIGDDYADGEDLSWLWDAHVERLSEHRSVVALATYGSGAQRMALRLAAAGFSDEAITVLHTSATLSRWVAQSPVTCFILSTYTLLQPIRKQLLASAPVLTNAQAKKERITSPFKPPASHPVPSTKRIPLRIVHLYPQRMGLYGDRGNVAMLRRRAKAVGWQVEITEIEHFEPDLLLKADIIVIGGGPDTAERDVAKEFFNNRNEWHAAVEDGVVLLGICGGYQLLGERYLTLSGEVMRGAGIQPFETIAGRTRMVGRIAIRNTMGDPKVYFVGFENHSGRTYGVPAAMGRVLYGHGNNGEDGQEGFFYRNTIGTYLHGPVLALNPWLTDWLLAAALERRGITCALEDTPVDPLAQKAHEQYLKRILGPAVREPKRPSWYNAS
ncbi:MAG: DUF1727 domain-containing protein [Firmicutes bacterium]|nr:DUF1727 domain-containing protein [Bacillota bacterium]